MVVQHIALLYKYYIAKYLGLLLGKRSRINSFYAFHTPESNVLLIYQLPVYSVFVIHCFLAHEYFVRTTHTREMFGMVIYRNKMRTSIEPYANVGRKITIIAFHDEVALGHSGSVKAKRGQ